MPKLFLFAIGGTGSRVLRSAIMLMASGLRMNANNVIPIIIDPDNANHDLGIAMKCLRHYQEIQSQAGNLPEGFFSISLENIFPAASPYRMNLMRNVQTTFRNYILSDTMDAGNNYLAKLLFSEHQLNLDMQEGFKGNPNLGSIVLNQFEQNSDFNVFANQFQPGDRIFIISSIHGGTGAAGFPLLLKTLRNINANFPHVALINNASIGGITVLPYFNLHPEETPEETPGETPGEIQSADFISKTKAALEYYQDNINPMLNALYYIGFNRHLKPYDNHPGGLQQQNPAHFIEMAAALSIFDFMNTPDDNLAITGHRFMEFGINDDTEQEITFKEIALHNIRRPLSKFMFFSKFIDLHLEKKHPVKTEGFIPHSISKQPWGMRGSNALGKNFHNSDFFTQQIKPFNEQFKIWVDELSKNSPSFYPFKHRVVENELTSQLIRNWPVKQNKLKNFIKNDFVLFDDVLNGCERLAHISNEKNNNRKFLALFNEATDVIVNKIF